MWNHLFLACFLKMTKIIFEKSISGLRLSITDNFYVVLKSFGTFIYQVRSTSAT